MLALDLQIPGSWPLTGLATTYEEYSANGVVPCLQQWKDGWGLGTRL